jgi:hypothetical protein
MRSTTVDTPLKRWYFAVPKGIATMRTINLASIDEQIKKLEELRRFMADPTTAHIIEQLISQNGTNGTARSATFESSEGQRGDLMNNVAIICRSFATGFTAKDVIERLDLDGFKFQAQDKLIAVNGALRRLVKKGVIKLVSVGTGKRPSVYKIPERFPRVAEESQ